jgi:endoglucanase
VAEGLARCSRVRMTRREILRRAAITTALAPVARYGALAASAQPEQPFLRGVSLAGAEFGQLVPGQFGREYTYPTASDFAFCAAQGMNIVRLPFKWERLQPDLDKAFDTEEWSRLSGAINAARNARLSLILDPHNYARRRVRDDDFTIDHMIGSGKLPIAAFADFWRQLASRTKDDAHVIFGLMNEPYDIAATAWLDIANQAIAAIRSTGARQLVLVPGTAYTGAHSWNEAGNTALEAIKDPVEHFAIEVHQYLDRDSSGSGRSVVSETIGSERLQAFQTWARSHKLKAFLGEFGAGPDRISLKALANIVREVENNRDVWIGWTAWAAGPWWPDGEAFRLSPSTSGELPPQMKLLSDLARAAP